MNFISRLSLIAGILSFASGLQLKENQSKEKPILPTSCTVDQCNENALMLQMGTFPMRDAYNGPYPGGCWGGESACAWHYHSILRKCECSNAQYFTNTEGCYLEPKFTPCHETCNGEKRETCKPKLDCPKKPDNYYYYGYCNLVLPHD
uniref:Secreted protein n=1 Tax=Chromera velia CCMP2878 TaxID=1169474 RepID=A0A0G4FE72_9ALVE|eukprot:Cvel_16478.t1-p1 / transcript=Cvel_16478.t1 / gene=Cvel_16478 / organism=Chromera_velia_CCMP2878 / gene_product=hypothetical protein / transcript_product=hypothetical protein / location=Cvel_scaffold1270:30991-31431(-) / protein_length=147 / sequence_SO=supercontig / SO=protein_coding / is_pseudo=false